MSDRIVFVAEYKCDEKHWIERELDKLGENYLFIDDKTYNKEDYKKKYGRLIYWRKYFKLANKTIKKTNDNDVIVTLTFSVGLIMSLLCMIKRKKRNILALNCIAYDNSRLDFIKIPLFRKMFLSNNLISTVNAQEYIDKFDKKFSLNKKKVFYLLNDPYNERFIDNNYCVEYGNEEMFCFSGGEANRDWPLLLEVASKIKYINFKITAREYMWDKNLDIPCNVNVAFDENMECFIDKIKKSSIVIVPLKDDMVAGLTVFIQAIAMKKFVLVTDIPATRIYVPDECRDILINIGDKDDLINKINYYMNNPSKKNVIIEKLYDNLVNKFSAQNYVENIIKIVNKQFK